MSFASLFTSDGPTPSPFHTFETGTPDAPDEPKKAQSKAPAQRPDTFIVIDELEVADTDTVNKWAKALVSHYNFDIRQIVSVGHHTNTYGCWAFETFKTVDGGQGGYKRMRLADATQMREIWEAHTTGEISHFWELVNGEMEDGRSLPGPYRKDRPPVDAKGNPIEEQASRGEHGPLPDECKWIEAHDNTFIEYLGTDVNWPNGCWQVDKQGCEVQYLDIAGVKYVAHTILGMPLPGVVNPFLPKKRAQQLKARAQANGNGFASLFVEEAPETQETAGGFASLFV